MSLAATDYPREGCVKRNVLKTIYLVKDLARASGHSVYTVEYYLKEGLLKEFGRSPYSNYRYFDDRAVQQLKRIRQMRKQKKSIKDIRTSLDI